MSDEPLSVERRRDPAEFDDLDRNDLWNDELFDFDDDATRPIQADDSMPAGVVDGGNDEPPVDEAEADGLPTSDSSWIEPFVYALGLVVLTAYMLLSVHIERVLTSAVPTGGDMGAHVWGPAYLRDHLLPKGQLTGWADGWYSGFPMYQYYMLPPALLIVLLDVLLPYGMAFKIVAVLGLVTLPICLFVFGKLARFAFPIPLLFAIGGVIFALDESFKIQGGNLASTMAGEFSFSIALSLAFLAFGFFARGLETGKHRVTATVLVALAALCHGIVMIFVGLGCFVLGIVWVGRRAGILGTWFWSTAPVAMAVAAFWLVPFVVNSPYMTDMKYEAAPRSGIEWDTYWTMFFPLSTFTDRFWMVLAVVGALGAVRRKHLNGIWLAVMVILLFVAVPLSKDGLPGLGLLWNTRVLPFLYICRYLLAMLGIFELFAAVFWAATMMRAGRVASLPLGSYARSWRATAFSPARTQGRRASWNAVLGIGTLLISIGWLSWHFAIFPLQRETYDPQLGYRMEWPHFGDRDENGNFKPSSSAIFKTPVKKGYVTGWANWNFSGYEGLPGKCNAGYNNADLAGCKEKYGEYYDLVQTMKRLGADPEYGCGRALWEKTEGDYGTPMALMLLPHWTDGCIGSSEGLFFESSATTPYHFLAVAAMSQNPSNPVRGLSYDNKAAEKGVEYMKQLGIRYYMAWTPEAVERAAQRPELTEIVEARNDPWRVYLVAGGDLVTSLDNEPVVVEERGGDQRERWLEIGSSWFQNRSDWESLPVAEGEPGWQRMEVESTEDPTPNDSEVDVYRPKAGASAKALTPVQITNVRQGDDTISFDVDQIGVPVLVRVSYFPNWTVLGGNGPYRAAPNMMVVVPTSNTVRLEYRRTTTDWVAYLLSFMGLAVLVGLGRFVKLRRTGVDEFAEVNKYELADVRLHIPEFDVPDEEPTRSPRHAVPEPPWSAPLIDESPRDHAVARAAQPPPALSGIPPLPTSAPLPVTPTVPAFPPIVPSGEPTSATLGSASTDPIAKALEERFWSSGPDSPGSGRGPLQLGEPDPPAL